MSLSPNEILDIATKLGILTNEPRKTEETKPAPRKKPEKPTNPEPEPQMGDGLREVLKVAEAYLGDASAYTQLFASQEEIYSVLGKYPHLNTLVWALVLEKRKNPFGE